MKFKTRLVVTFLTIILLPLVLACTAFLFIGGYLTKGQEEYGLRNSDYSNFGMQDKVTPGDGVVTGTIY